MKNEISKRLGVGMTYSDKLKSGVRRLTYMNTDIHVSEAYSRIGDTIQNIVIRESQTVDNHYIRVYIY